MRLTSHKEDEATVIERLRASLPDFPQLEAVMSGFHEVLDPVASRPLMVGVSGGGDSIALLLLLHVWARRELVVAHVDHGLQNQSAVWAQGVAALCQQIGVKFIGLKWADPVTGLGVSNAARLARHRLLAEAAREAGASVICLGHNLDDAAEAAWMRAQGSNTGTAKAFAPSPVWPEGRDIFLYRPLIGVGRQVLRDWLKASGVDYLDDPANADPKYLRSRARLALAGHDQMSHETPKTPTAIDAETSQTLCFCPEILAPFGVIALKINVLNTLSPEPVHRVLAAAAVAAGGGETLPITARVMALRDWLNRPVPDGETQKRTLCGALIIRTDNVVYFGRDMADARLKRRDSGLEITTLAAGQAMVWDGRFEIKALKSLMINPNLGQGLMRSKAMVPAARAQLMALPADFRRGLPVATDVDIEPTKKDTSPIALWENYNLPIYSAEVRVRALVAARFAAALGLMVREPQAHPYELMD